LFNKGNERMIFLKNEYLQKKIKILGIEKKEKINKIKKLKYIPFPDIEYKESRIEEKQYIRLDKLVGLNRPDAHQFKNWLEVLDSLHKMRNFNEYNKEKFEKIILEPPLIDNTPQVINFENNYYIDGEGKHRLTMAKCLGLEGVLADVIHIEEY